VGYSKIGLPAMKREHFSAAVALDLEGAQAPQGEPYSNAETRASGHVGELVSRFHAAAQEQGSAHAALAARIDRLEDDETANELRQTMRELHGALSSLASETASSIVRIEDRIVAVAETVAALGASMESANSAFRHLSVSAHEKIAGLGELLNSTIQRVEQGEKSTAELKAAETGVCASITSLSEKLGLVRDRLDQEHKETSQLGEQLRLAEGQIVNFRECEGRVGALENRESELRKSVHSLSEKHDVLGDRLAEEQKETRQLGEQLRLVEGQIANLPEYGGRVGALENRESELSKFVHSLSERLAGEQKETSDLGEQLRLVAHQIANLPEYGGRFGALEERESELSKSVHALSEKQTALRGRLAEEQEETSQLVKSLREIQVQNGQMSADVGTLSEGLRSLHAEVDSVSARHGDLKTRIEQAETGLSSSLEQGRALATLHARLAETYSAR
jgi:chromosome segregation ATPase